MKLIVHCALQRFPRTELQARIEEAKGKATKEVLEGAMKLARAFGDEYWSSDNMHNRVDHLIININSDDQDELFLDSDAD